MATSTQSNLEIVKAYYEAVSDGDLDRAGRYLAPDIEFISPLGNTSGKESVLEALKGFASNVRVLQQRAAFELGNRVMLVYDVSFDQPIGILRTAVLIEVENSLISRTELFHDAAPFKAQHGKPQML